MFLTSMSSQVIEIDPGVSYQEVVFGGDAKLTVKKYADGNPDSVSEKLFNQMGLKIFRVPIFALQPITDPIYDDIVKVIKSAKAVNPDVKIFASIANGDGYGEHYHGASKFPSSMKCCAYNVYSLNLTAYAKYLDSFMQKMTDNGITIDYLGPWNEDPADDSDHQKVFNQMSNLGTTQKVGLERWALLTSVNDVDDVEDRVDVIGSHFYDDETIDESEWDASWASLVEASEDPVWYTESTRYSTNDNIDRLVAGLNNIFPPIRGGAEAVIFYQACNRIVYANGGTPKIKYSGFKNMVTNASGKVISSISNQLGIKVVAFGDGSTINVHILNTSDSDEQVTLNLANDYNISGTVTRNIWTSSDTGTSNSFNLSGDASMNVFSEANSYTHLNIPLNKDVASLSTNLIKGGKLNVIQDVNGAINISLPQSLTKTENVFVKIYAINGSEVVSKTKEYSENILIKQNLPSGIYFINLVHGSKIYHAKLLISN